MPSLAAPGRLPELADFYYAMMLELGMLHDPLAANWRDIFIAQHAAAMREGTGAWFVIERDGKLAACAGALMDTSAASKMSTARSGIIIGVYVKPEYRRRGFARELTQACLDWFRTSGVTRIRLQASPYARPLYESLGFKPGVEMRLNLD